MPFAFFGIVTHVRGVSRERTHHKGWRRVFITRGPAPWTCRYLIYAAQPECDNSSRFLLWQIRALAASHSRPDEHHRHSALAHTLFFAPTRCYTAAARCTRVLSNCRWLGAHLGDSAGRATGGFSGDLHGENLNENKENFLNELCGGHLRVSNSRNCQLQRQTFPMPHQRSH